MKKVFALLWILLPVVLVAWHYGPGQAQMSRDRAGEYLSQARRASAEGDRQKAAALYEQAAKELPKEDSAAKNRLRLAQACNRVQAGQIVEGQEQLEEILADLQESGGDRELEHAARHELAAASYYAAWIMRLEGATAEEWEPEAERARQQFRLVAERQQETDPDSAAASKKNVEATIRLQQMDLSTLRAMPPPKNCPKCKNLSQRKRKQSQSKCKGQGKGKKKKKKKEDDARKQIKQAKNAGINERTGTGS